MNTNPLTSSFKQGSALLAALVLVALGAPTVLAGPIFYGDFSDIPPGTVTYTNVFEQANSPGDTPPLYGAPSISPIDANQLAFTPSGFSASSTGGPLDITDGQLNFGIETEPGAGLTSLSFNEGGDFTFVGTGGVGTTVGANLIVNITIFEVDDALLPAPIQLTRDASFASDITVGDGPRWDIDLLVDLAPLLPDGFSLGATKLSVALNNQLFTNSEEDSLAIIAKKDFSVTPGGNLVTPAIPEPSSVLLVFAGLAAAAARRR